MNRDKEWNEKKKAFEKERDQHIAALKAAREEVEAAKKTNASNVSELEEKLKKLKAVDKEWQQKEKDINKEEKRRPLNVDTISKEGKTRTVSYRLF